MRSRGLGRSYEVCDRRPGSWGCVCVEAMSCNHAEMRSEHIHSLNPSCWSPDKQIHVLQPVPGHWRAPAMQCSHGQRDKKPDKAGLGGTVHAEQYQRRILCKQMKASRTEECRDKQMALLE